MEQCQFCGSNNIKQITLQHQSLLLCQLCGEASGSTTAVALYHELKEAEHRDMDPDIFPLVKLFETIPGFTVSAASYGEADLLIPPFIAFHLQSISHMKWLEKLMISMRHADGKTRTHWIVQVTLLNQLTFELKPDFAIFSHSLDRHAIKNVQSDIPTLLQNLDRDMNLSWWSQ